MAFTDYEKGLETSNVKFNAGFFQIIRIHEVQRLINIAKINPSSFNKDYNLWNYQLWFNCLNTLLDEIWSKLHEEEKTTANKDRVRMVNFVSSYDVLQNKSFEGSDKKLTMVNSGRFQKLYLLLIEYDNYVKELMDAHGWNNPTMDDDDPY